MSKRILVMSDSAKLTMASETDIELGQIESSVIDQTALLHITPESKIPH